MISFIIPIYNSEKTLRQCIESVEKQDVEKEIILVDNNSTDQSPAIIKEYAHVIPLAEKKKGPAAARNKGRKQAKGEFIAFIDSDVELPVDWAKKALRILNNDKKLGGVGGPGVSDFENYVTTALNAMLYGKPSSIGETKVNSLATMDVLYRREAIEGIKFNEEFEYPAGEDVEFNFEIIRKGFSLLYSRELAVAHHHPITLRAMVKKWYGYGKNYATPYKRYPEFRDKGFYLRVLFAYMFFALPFFALASRVFIYLWLLQISLIFFIYTLFGLRLGSGLWFPVVHTIKQLAQIIGIFVTSIEQALKKERPE